MGTNNTDSDLANHAVTAKQACELTPKWINSDNFLSLGFSLVRSWSGRGTSPPKGWSYGAWATEPGEGCITGTAACEQGPRATPCAQTWTGPPQPPLAAHRHRRRRSKGLSLTTEVLTAQRKTLYKKKRVKETTRDDLLQE